jgi:hypothetical protein
MNRRVIALVSLICMVLASSVKGQQKKVMRLDAMQRNLAMVARGRKAWNR